MAGDGVMTRPHVRVTCKRRRVDVTVCPLQNGSYIAVVVHGEGKAASTQLAEYITDAVHFDDAVGAGVEIAQALIDRRAH
jgi:hypothetical protein